MNYLLQRAVLTVGLFVFAALGVQLILPAQQVSAQGQEEQSQQEQQETEEREAEQSQPAGSYQYVAQPGDTYSQMARKAIQTYGIVNRVNLSQAQIMMAETNMTLEAGSPILTTGQQVEITNAAVEKWVENAQKISDASESAWQEYAKYADFNTDNVGE